MKQRDLLFCMIFVLLIFFVKHCSNYERTTQIISNDFDAFLFFLLNQIKTTDRNWINIKFFIVWTRLNSLGLVKIFEKQIIHAFSLALATKVRLKLLLLFLFNVRFDSAK